MLYEIFNSFKKDFCTERIDKDITQNLNPKFELREYQIEALGRFLYYLAPDCPIQKQQPPIQLLFHMATGSGKTLIMAANILQLYKQGYRNFIFFVNSINIIEKTRDNFLNPLSEKYLFAPKIKFNGKEVFIKEVQNFEGVSPDDINILFTTIQGLHIRMTQPRENVLTEEDFNDRDVVLISDEAHHLQTITKNNKTEQELEKSWEYTVLKRIFGKNSRNILLEFTATIDLRNENIRKKYEDKILYQYDLKQFRLAKYSKEIEVLQADLEPIDRALQAVIISQYRRKIAEKYKLHLKPVILFKSKSIKESRENYEKFLDKIKNLSNKDIGEIYSRAKGTILGKVFDYLQKENVSFENLIKELQEDFSEEKVMLIDSENIDEKKQLLLNSLETRDNEVRTIFAVNMLNEGWDVLNLFDIVRLYHTRDGKWVHGKYKPGNTTIGEAQLIGRGARYWPFQLEPTDDKYKRKFDTDIENELRTIETLYYHCLKEPNYIHEIKSTLTEMGILSEKYEERGLFIKDDFKKSDFWKEGVIFLNDRTPNPRTDINSLKDAKIEEIYPYKLKTGEIKEELIFDEEISSKSSKTIEQNTITYNLLDLGENIIRSGLDKLEFYRFETLKRYFPNIKSIKEFILSYLGSVKVEVSGPKNKINKLSPIEKLEIVLFILRKISEQAKTNTSEFKGTKLFNTKMLKDVFRDKIVKIDKDKIAEDIQPLNLAEKDWFAQTDFYGTSEEENFLEFIDGFIENLKQKYSDIVILRNEKFFQIFDFDEGRPFEPDFLMLLRTKKHKILIYQVFIEPKGDQFKDNKGRFENSKEGWKQKFLLEIENKAEFLEDLAIRMQNKHFKLFGLPFYNKSLEKEFQEALEKIFL